MRHQSRWRRKIRDNSIKINENKNNNSIIVKKNEKKLKKQNKIKKKIKNKKVIEGLNSWGISPIKE